MLVPSQEIVFEEMCLFGRLRRCGVCMPCATLNLPERQLFRYYHRDYAFAPMVVGIKKTP